MDVIETLLSTCPGFRLSKDAKDAIRSGRVVDFDLWRVEM